MHPSSMENMRKFRDKYLFGHKNLRVLDVGSQDINGSYKELFGDHEYVGFDKTEGKNVDITDWTQIKNDSFDIVISGQAFEHIEDDLKTMKEIARVLKPYSYICIIAPSVGPKHCLPDYRRYQPDDLRTLAEKVGLIVLAAWIDPTGKWKDCVLIASKIQEMMHD